MTLSLLDGSVPNLEAAIPNLSLGELELLLEAENAGKTRIGAVRVLTAAIEAANAVPDEPLSNEVENILPGTTLHLGDGRRLKYGERAEVSEALAALLRERGQAA